jgi:V8-like Glu-specific endopeptidase
VATLRFWSRFICLAALAATAGTARAAIFSGDDRVAVRPQARSPYAPIGRVIGERMAGTGFLVSKCDVLTVQHAFSESRPAVGQVMTFRATQIHSGRSPPTSRGTVVASGNFDVAPQAGDWSEGRSKDWMLIRLDTCLGKSLGYVELGGDRWIDFNGPGALLRSAGYPFDRASPDTLVLDPSCRLRGANFREWMHDCAALPGNSGSPLFQEIRSRGRVRLRVVAMITCGEHTGQARPYDPAHANRATKVAYILPAIAAFIAPN